MISRFVSQYLPPLLLAVIVMLAVLLLIAWLARRGTGWAGSVWGGIVRQRAAVSFFCAVMLFIVAFTTFLVRSSGNAGVRSREALAFDSASNLISTGPLTIVAVEDNKVPIQPAADGTKDENDRNKFVLSPDQKGASNVVLVRPGETYRYSLYATTLEIDAAIPDAEAQVRLTWLGPALNVLSWSDSPPFPARGRGSQLDEKGFYSSAFTVPVGATRLQIEVRNIDKGSAWLLIWHLQLTTQSVYVEPHPNGAQGSLAFSFDWESAMGGAVHSQGATVHDPASASAHGLLMRQGADWLNNLFTAHDVHATFYATGYNLLDGNTEGRTFSGDPVYQWAKRKYGWETDYWLTHPWFSDDPHGTYHTDPAWYFGDQTRTLLNAGHEVAPHTFAHIYVRGSNPAELSTDMDEWLKAASAQGVLTPTTFAFPWRSSNSLSAEFYDVLYKRGIRAVTRLYAPDMRDLYTLGAAPVYSYMAVVPDFLLGAPSSSAGEEAGGSVISLQKGLDVITEALARRGTTSFWTHPEQLGDDPRLQPVRDAWSGVVTMAAQERDNGRLWIGTVAEITAYQRDVMSVTTTLGKASPAIWKLGVINNSGHGIKGVTVTLPGDAVRVSSPDAEVRIVLHPAADKTILIPVGQGTYQTRQIVVTDLKPGLTSIDLEWPAGEEPQG